MSWVRDNLKWLAVLVCSLLAAGAGFSIWQQQSDNTKLTQQLTASNTQRDLLTGQLKTAETTISTQSGQIFALVDLNRQQSADIAAQLQRLDTITRNATARAIKLEAITHEDEAARIWGDTRLPDSVASLLDNIAPGSDAASQDYRDAGLRAGSGVPPASHPQTNRQLAQSLLDTRAALEACAIQVDTQLACQQRTASTIQ